MLTHEAEMLLAYMQELWPKWDYNPAVAKLWLEWLTGPLDYEDARRAVKKYRLSSRYNSPQPDGLRDALRSVSTGEGHEADGGYGGYYIECVSGPVAGRRIPVTFGDSRNVPSEYIVRERGEKMRAAHEGTYGGEWRLIEGPDYAKHFTGVEPVTT